MSPSKERALLERIAAVESLLDEILYQQSYLMGLNRGTAAALRQFDRRLGQLEEKNHSAEVVPLKCVK